MSSKERNRPDAALPAVYENTDDMPLEGDRCSGWADMVAKSFEYSRLSDWNIWAEKAAIKSCSYKRECVKLSQQPLKFHK